MKSPAPSISASPSRSSSSRASSRPAADPQTRFERIIDLVCQCYQVERHLLLSRRRERASVTDARHVAMYLARELTDEASTTICQRFQRKSHGAVLHAAKAVRNRMEIYPIERQTITQLRALILNETTSSPS